MLQYQWLIRDGACMSESSMTRGGFTPSGVAAERRASVESSPTSKATRTRHMILEAARAEFDRYGYTNTTIEHIVTKADVARGSFYTYFESKIDVFRHLAATIDREVASDVVAFERKRSGNPIENLRISNRNYLAVVRRNADLYRLVDEASAHDEEIKKQRLQSRQQHIARVAASIRRWQSKGWADPDLDASLTAAALVSMLSGFAQWLHVGGDTYDDDAAEQTLTEIWIRACKLADPDEVSQ